jgi:phosphatidylglycerol:prolipoprotein diacylglycerol transferase
MQPLIPYFAPLKISIFGDFAIHGFGILVAAGFIFGSQMGQRKCMRDGLDPELINRLVGYLVISLFVGGHMGHVLFYEPMYYLDNPIEIFYFWDGLSSIGGILMAMVMGTWLFTSEAKKRRIANKRRVKAGEAPIPEPGAWPYVDTVAYGITLGWCLGRFGCFTAHDHPGLVSDFYLAVYGICEAAPSTKACHDLGFYEALWMGTLTLLFIVLDRKPRFPGFFAGMLLMLYGPVRFAMDTLRTADTRYFNETVTPAQIAGILFTVAGIALLAKRRGTTPWVPVAIEGKAATEAAES